jgi:arachidonate 15-lipoxygenase (second type)/8-lipoxygenase (S-type)
MFFQRLALEGLALSLVQSINAAIIPRQAENPASALLGLIGSLDTSATQTPANPFTLPGAKFTIAQNANSPVLRATGITATRLTFLYGPPVAGGPFFPTGTTGLIRVAADLLAIQMDVRPELTGAALDSTQATTNLAQYDGLDSVQDYTKLYPNNFENTLPRGPDAGAETNFTQDLFFSMERLANSPYQVRRLNPSSESLAFKISDATARKISGYTLQNLFSAGRLFYADYRDQKDLTPTTHYGAACDAYFYIDPSSGDFLPLAIRTGVGANLIYTPEDTANDWLLAKIMLNTNDFWFAQWNHLAQSHEVVQIAYMAAIRTLSDTHPVLALLNRLMFEVFAIQPLAATVLFTPGTVVDQIFPYTGASAQAYTTDYYKNKGSGRFQSNYFKAELEARGLINSKIGPSLKSFPFYEDASVIHDAIEKFMTAFVGSYYASNKAITGDTELQDWVNEAQGPAEAIDFPSIRSKKDLIDVLTHFVSC